MAKKTYLIKQERKFNGDVTVASASYECDEAEISGLVALLEGVVTVMEENLSLSSAEGASNVVTGGLPIDSVSLVHSEAKTKYFGAYNKPLLFKATTSVTELQNLFKTHKPFSGAYETEAPDNVFPKVSHMGAL
ncbi:hypothetical protein ALC152_03960 [Arcobacter sp. 15-2]|uniref:hypothetical protein n=1 Tax=Arcobacter sp. 15-2 TaxID=3374109 RepID=UPI00399C8EC3